MILAITAELLKIRHTSFTWVSFIAFGLAPVMGAVFMLILGDEEALARTGGLAMKAQAMNFKADWASYFDILNQAVGVGGIMVFGFVASWIFGREYADGTAKDMLSLPVSRDKIVHGKFIVFFIWCLLLVTANFILCILLGTLCGLQGLSATLILQFLPCYYITTILTILSVIPMAFFALWGRGYLSPLGFMALTLVFAQVVAAAGYGAYFPWSVPGLYSGAGGAYKMLLTWMSYLLLMITAVVGYWATLFFWSRTDQR